LRDYLGNVIGDRGIPQDNPTWIDRLCGLGFMNERDHGDVVCTIAGLVLFGYKPRRLLRQAGVRWMAFAGIDKSYRALDDAILDGPLVGLWQLQRGGRELIGEGLIEQTTERMRPFVSEESEELIDSVRRERHWHYPPAATREAIVNALSHRDWTRYSDVEVVAYQNRLEIMSPGALQNSMTIAKMIAGQRSPRNPLIVDVLRDYGYVDARGMGVRNKIIPLVRALSGQDPEFIATEDFVTVTMPKNR
jgi:ATP-dependent DNA helicase RecG